MINGTGDNQISENEADLITSSVVTYIGHHRVIVMTDVRSRAL